MRSVYTGFTVLGRALQADEGIGSRRRPLPSTRSIAREISLRLPARNLGPDRDTGAAAVAALIVGTSSKEIAPEPRKEPVGRLRGPGGVSKKLHII